MHRETAQVVGFENGRAKLRLAKQKACGCCRLNYICGGDQKEFVSDPVGLSLKQGDKVEVAVSVKRSLLSNLIIFFVPAVVFLSSLYVFRSWGELSSFFLALASLAVYYIVAKWLLRGKEKGFNLQILRKL